MFTLLSYPHISLENGNNPECAIVPLDETKGNQATTAMQHTSGVCNGTSNPLHSLFCTSRNF